MGILNGTEHRGRGPKVFVPGSGQLLNSTCIRTNQSRNSIRFSRACVNFGFTISTKKTEVMHQPAPRKMYHEPHIFVNDEPLKATDSFTYLGSTLSREDNIDVEVNNELSKAKSAFWKTQKESVGQRRNQPRDQVKGIRGCGANCPACESRTVYSRHARKLNHSHTKCLRIILSIKWAILGP